MAEWHRTRRGDLGLRALGSGLWALAGLALARLFALHGAPHPVGIAAGALAGIGFLCGSAGTALLMVGAHLFDTVEISARWR